VEQDNLAAGPNVLAGTIANRLFTGEAMDYQVEVGAEMIRCRTPASQRMGTGKPVTLLLPAQHCIALRRNVAAAGGGHAVP
jgi:iron(III) transport system ATP-binding protein